MPARLQRFRLHLVVWGAALGLYALIFHRLARVLALDLEALAYNQAEGLAARVDHQALDTDALLLLLAALPLVLVVTARGGYALARWLRGTDDPLGALPLWARGVIFGVALGGLHLFAGPCSRALSVWWSVEAFGWIQWSGNVQPVMQGVLQEAPLLLRVLLMAAGALALWLALGRGSPAVPLDHYFGQRGRSWPRRLLRLGGAAAALLLLVSLAVVVGLHGARAVSAPGLGLFSDTCGGCHIRARPLFLIKSPSQWETTVTRMRTLEKAPLSEAQAAEVVGFLSGMRSFTDRWTFTTRCQRCHGPGSLFWRSRPAADWDRITRRLARHSPYYYKAPVRRQITAHLRQTHGDEAATFGLSAQRYRATMALADACETCHSVTRGAARARRLSYGGALELLGRMNTKRPRPWTPTQLAAHTRTYRALVADAGLLERLFPHHAPAEGGPSW